jgi:hypothetical protein
LLRKGYRASKGNALNPLEVDYEEVEAQHQQFLFKNYWVKIKDPSSSHPHVEENIYFQNLETAGSNTEGEKE